MKKVKKEKLERSITLSVCLFVFSQSTRTLECQYHLAVISIASIYMRIGL